MERNTKRLTIAACMICLLISVASLIPRLSYGQSDEDIWVTAYLASWKHYAPPTGNWGVLPADEIEFDAFSHLIYFALSAYSDGTVSEVAPYRNLNPDRLESIVQASHENDTPIIMSVGGWGNYDGFSGAILPENRTNFVNSLIDFIETWGFDGIDLDMEPIRNSDTDNFKAFVQELHEALKDVTTPHSGTPLLTAATDTQPGMWAEIQDYFDQINLMTYDYSGAWQGWVTWHNSAIWTGGNRFPNVDRELPATERSVRRFLNAGVDPSMLGIGLDFYGYRWTGVYEPLEGWDEAPDVESNISYYDLAEEYGIESEEDSGPYYHWDEEAGAAYLSIDDPENYSQPKFISYDNERTAREKIQYTRDNNLGGMIIWELGGGYQKNKPRGERDILLQSVKEAWKGDAGSQNPVALDTPEIIFPEEEAAELPSETEIKWQAIEQASKYEFRLSTSSSLSAVEIDTTLENTIIELDGLERDTDYYYTVRASNGQATSEWSNTRTFTTYTPMASDEPGSLPQIAELDQNYPNPFNPVTTISYKLPEDTPVELEVLSVEGRRITVLVDEHQTAGRHHITFDASDLASGVYMYRLRAGSTVETRTMTFVK